MTRAEAFTLLVENVTGLDPDVDRALNVLRPAFVAKPRKAKVPPYVREIIKRLDRPEGWHYRESRHSVHDRWASEQERRYLESFDDPERAKRRLAEMQNGPSPEAYGGPVREVVPFGREWREQENARAEYEKARNAWLKTERGEAWQTAKAFHDARSAQLAYKRPRAKMPDDELRTFIAGSLEGVMPDTEPLRVAV